MHDVERDEFFVMNFIILV